MHLPGHIFYKGNAPPPLSHSSSGQLEGLCDAGEPASTREQPPRGWDSNLLLDDVME